MTSSWKRTVAITHWLQAGCHDSDVINAKTFVCLITFIFVDISVYETNLLRIPHCDAIYFLTQCVDIPTQISWAQLNGLHWTTNTLLKVFRWYFNFTVIALCFVYWNCYKSYLIQIMLTHLPLDKMAAILADDNFKGIFFNENYSIPIRISLKFVPRSAIDNKPALVQIMTWRRRGDKPLTEPMLT